MMNDNITASCRVVLSRALAGCIWGTAVGDALGLPCEGLPPRRIVALFGDVPDKHRFLFRRGMISDDTEHTFLVWDALTASAGEGEAFTRRLSSGLRRWILALPAGVGLATLRAGVRLVFGVPTSRSGVFSAGNGPAMRAAILGVACAWDRDRDRLRDLVSRSSRLTHTDPKAEHGALAVAIGAACFARAKTEAGAVLSAVADVLPRAGAEELREWLTRVAESISRGESTASFAARQFPRGVSGYVNHTVPVALHAVLSYPDDFRTAVRGAIACGGDTDTIAAITGGIVGAHVGIEGIPDEWRRRIYEPTDVMADITARSDSFARSWSAGTIRPTPTVPYVAALLRNFLFACVVIWHGFRRLLPPYGR